MVEIGVYRSSIPNAQNFDFLKSLSLNVVLLLTTEVPERCVRRFFQDEGIQVIHLGLKKQPHVWTEAGVGWKNMSEDLFKEALEIVLNSSFHPICIMCSSGKHKTGTLVGCLRRMQNWCLSSILDEYMSYAGKLHRFVNEQFIELFDVDLVNLPPNIPSWFRTQKEMLDSERDEYDLLVNQGDPRIIETNMKDFKITTEDPRPAYKVYYHCGAAPLISTKSTFTEASLCNADSDDD